MNDATADMQVDSFQKKFRGVRAEMARVIVGNEEVIDGVLTCLLARGHGLIEGVPGTGKTKLIQTLADVLHLKFSRIQFTPDLMPGDIVGGNVLRESERGEKVLEFQPGPVFANLILADEIDRALPVASPVKDYAIRLTLATHPENAPCHAMVKKYVRYGSSPRGAQALLLGGKVHALMQNRVYVASEDIRAAAFPALRHRMLLNYEGEAEQLDVDTIISAIIQSVPEPRK